MDYSLSFTTWICILIPFIGIVSLSVLTLHEHNKSV